MTSPILELRGIERRFGRATVLAGVSIALRGGEVHVLAGENGAGKTTLVRILSGVDTDFSGAMLLDGAAHRFTDPHAARRAGVATIHQELSLVGSLSIADNLALGREKGSPFGFLSRQKERDETARRLAALDIGAAPEDLVETLPLGVQQLLEVEKALAEDASVLLFDEPTSALGDAEAERLFQAIEKLRQQGKAILFVSHRTADLDRIADRVTVLRDGKVALSKAYAEVSRGELVAALLGRATDGASETSAATADAVSALALEAVRVVDDKGREVVTGASFDVAAGEIVGLTGLRGCGASELLEAICAAHGKVDGKLAVDGRTTRIDTPRSALDVGIAFLPADRQRASVIPRLSSIENATLASLARFSNGPFRSDEAERRAVLELVEPLRLGRVDLDAPLATLSGGTQQKVCLARALLTGPRVLLLDEPTRGVDLGAKADIHRWLADAARRGLAVVFATTDTDELFALAHRIVVMARGRVTADLPRASATREAVLHAATSGVEAA